MWSVLYLTPGIGNSGSRESFIVPRYKRIRSILAGVLALVRPFALTNPSNEVLPQLLMYGNKDFPDQINKDIVELALQFIHETGQFD